MSYTFDQAINEQLANRSTVAELVDLVRNTSARVEGAPETATGNAMKHHHDLRQMEAATPAAAGASPRANASA
jgi:hypothetical protein